MNQIKVLTYLGMISGKVNPIRDCRHGVLFFDFKLDDFSDDQLKILEELDCDFNDNDTLFMVIN